MEIFRLLGTIAIDNDAALKAVGDTSKAAKDSSNETQEAFQKIGAVAGKIATGIGLAGAAIGGAWVAAIESTREYRTEMVYPSVSFIDKPCKEQFPPIVNCPFPILIVPLF